MALKDKVNMFLQKYNLEVVELAKTPAATGDTATSGATSGNTMPSVITNEIIPPTVKISYSAIGAPVFQIDADGKESAVEDGQHITKDNKMLTVEGGKLTKVEDVEPIEIEPVTGDTGTTKMSTEKVEVVIPVVEMASDSYPWDTCIADQKKAGYSDTVSAKICGKIKAKGTKMSAEEIATYMSAELAMAQSQGEAVKSALSRAGLDLSKAGSYCINISISEDGSVSYGTFSTNTYQDLMLAKEEEIGKEVEKLTNAFETKLSAQEKVIEALQHGETKVKINAPEASDVKLSKSDFIKLDIQAKKNNDKI